MGSPNIVTSDEDRRETWIYDKISTERAYSSSAGGVNALILGGAPVGSALLGGGLGGSYGSEAGAKDKMAADVSVTNDTFAAAAITNDSLNKDSGLQPSAMSHRVYANAAYAWDESEWKPTLGLGGSADISANNKAMSQWSVFAFGSICF